MAVKSYSGCSFSGNIPSEKEPRHHPMDHSAFASFHSSRLVRLLSNANDLDIRTSQAHFAEKFGQMLHFSNVIKLSSALEDASGAGSKPSKISGNDIRNTFISAQADIVRFIAAGFVPSARRIGDRLPTADSLHAHCKLTGVFSAKNKRKSTKLATIYEPYRKFYISRQSELEIKVQRLRSNIWNEISGFSPALAQLAGIDQALFESLSASSGEAFAVIPKLLGKRFSHLFETFQENFPENPEVSDFEQWIKPGGWLAAFCIEMRELLLAELEARLQPVVGMIDALPQPDRR